ncbi:MAG: hypothetical protein U0441_30260 [Polyangiaceae bacterium]
MLLIAGTTALLFGPTSAGAFELGFGLSAGGLAMGSIPRFSIAPHVALALQAPSGVRLAFHELLGIVPHPRGAGIYSQTAAEIGYRWEKFDLNIGPSLAIYAMPVCKPDICRHVEGVAPGVHLQGNVEIWGPVGLSVWGAMDFHLGDSSMLSGKFTATLLAGPFLRWRLG